MWTPRLSHLCQFNRIRCRSVAGKESIERVWSGSGSHTQPSAKRLKLVYCVQPRHISKMLCGAIWRTCGQAEVLCCTKCALNMIFYILGMMLNNVSTRGTRTRTDLHYRILFQLFCRTCLSLCPAICSCFLTNLRNCPSGACEFSSSVFYGLHYCTLPPVVFQRYCHVWSISIGFQDTCRYPDHEDVITHDRRLHPYLYMYLL